MKNKWKFIRAAAIGEDAFDGPAYEEELDWENNNYENQTSILFHSTKLAKIRGGKKTWNLFIVINWAVSSMCMFYPEENKAS